MRLNKPTPINRTILVFLLSIQFFTGGYAFSANIYVDEHKKQIRQKVSRKTTVPQNANLKKEKELILRQLDVITGDEETRYIIVPGDSLNIAYSDRGIIKEATYQVSGKGEIHMPLIGAVKVEGLNRKKTRENLNALMREYIRYPKIVVNVNVSGRFMVVGSVNSPGVYELEPKLTTLEAILNAGGFIKEEANMKSVLLIRGDINNPVITRLNLRKMIKRGDRTDNLMIKPGDMIHVPSTFIYNLDNFKTTVFSWLMEYYTLGALPVLSGYRSIGKKEEVTADE